MSSGHVGPPDDIPAARRLSRLLRRPFRPPPTVVVVPVGSVDTLIGFDNCADLYDCPPPPVPSSPSLSLSPPPHSLAAALCVGALASSGDRCAFAAPTMCCCDFFIAASIGPSLSSSDVRDSPSAIEGMERHNCVRTDKGRQKGGWMSVGGGGGASGSRDTRTEAEKRIIDQVPPLG
eukprot:GHVU01191289.1.p1 GENE.GHVU01191289.1~~GHVU01191289.1.p1  ORF type:complete len:177 (+),score=19.04 GHVU01191289.1:503-1033(+)